MVVQFHVQAFIVLTLRPMAALRHQVSLIDFELQYFDFQAQLFESILIIIVQNSVIGHTAIAEDEGDFRGQGTAQFEPNFYLLYQLVLAIKRALLNSDVRQLFQHREIGRVVYVYAIMYRTMQPTFLLLVPRILQLNQPQRVPLDVLQRAYQVRAKLDYGLKNLMRLANEIDDDFLQKLELLVLIENYSLLLFENQLKFLNVNQF